MKKSSTSPVATACVTTVVPVYPPQLLSVPSLGKAPLSMKPLADVSCPKSFVTYPASLTAK